MFMALCVPSHVPLDRLPSATGIHLLFSGLFYIVMGPIVGKILLIWNFLMNDLEFSIMIPGFVRDQSDYAITLHFLNIPTFLVAISWGLEKLVRCHKSKINQES